jgi:hypothetical protein
MPLSHQYIWRQLNLSKNSYNRLRSILKQKEFVSDAGEGAYGLVLTAKGRREFEKNHWGTGRVTTESALYEPLCDSLRESYPDDEVLNVGSLRRRGAWKNPDVLRVIARPGALGLGTLVHLVSYEVKRWTSAWSLSSVFEAASHAGFCHESYLVLEWAQDIAFSHEYLDVYGSHILEACRRFGVGLLVMHPIGDDKWRVERALLASDAHPNELSVHVYLDYLLGHPSYRESAERLRKRASGESVAPDGEDEAGEDE